MRKFFKIIKKQSKPRLVSGLWLLLLMVELICPVLGHEAADEGEIDSLRTASVYSSEIESRSAGETPSMTTGDNHRGDQVVCHDECLCHSTAIPSVTSITIRESVEKIERIPHQYGNRVFNFLPPPFQPPKNS